MPSTLLIDPTGAGVGATEVTGAITDLVAATGGGRLPLRLDGLTRAGHWTATSLPSRLNREWAGLCDSADNDVAVKDWAAPGQGRPGLTRLIGVDGLPSTVQLLQGTSVTVSGRDAVLVGLLERAQDGDRLAGRVVLQTMLPAAVRIAQGITGRPRTCSAIRTRRSRWCWPRCGRSSRPTPWPAAARRCRPTCTSTRSRSCDVATPAAPTGRWSSRSSPSPTSGQRPTPASSTLVATTLPVRPTRSCARCWPGLCGPWCCGWTRPSCWPGSTAWTAGGRRGTGAGRRVRPVLADAASALPPPRTPGGPGRGRRRDRQHGPARRRAQRGLARPTRPLRVPGDLWTVPPSTGKPWTYHRQRSR